MAGGISGGWLVARGLAAIIEGSIPTITLIGGAWLLLVFVMPPLTGFVARLVRPVPPRAVVIDAKRDAVLVTGGHRLPEQAAELKDPNSETWRTLRAYFAQHPHLAPSRPSDDDRYRLIFFLRMVEAERMASPVEEQWDAARDAQARLTARCGSFLLLLSSKQA
jgi:hypothetical protein